jgi:cystathionine beta-synthase
VIFHDHGSRYLGKMFNDDWMRDKGFLEKTGARRARSRGREAPRCRLVTVDRGDSVARVVQVMTENDFRSCR